MRDGILVNFSLKLIYATIAKPSSETTQNREKEFLHYSLRKEGIEKHDFFLCVRTTSKNSNFH
jgi:hypothetical protein